jgi:hypothetical protein
MALTADTRISPVALRGVEDGGALADAAMASPLDFDPVRPRWAGRRLKRAGGATAIRAFPARRPLSSSTPVVRASTPAVADEIDSGPAP